MTETTFHIRGATVEIKTATPRLTVTDHVLPPGFAGPPLHIHPGFDEVFVVLEGSLAIRVEDEVHEVGPGDTSYVAGTTPHTFANTSGGAVRFMVAIAPGGFEEYFRAMAAGDDEGAAQAAARFGYSAWPAG